MVAVAPGRANVLILPPGVRSKATVTPRLVSKQSGPWDWVGGAYYSDRKQSLSQVEPILGFASWSELPGSGRPAGCTVYNAATCPYPTFGDVIQYYQGGVRPSTEADPDLNFTLDRHVSFSDFANRTAQCRRQFLDRGH